MKNLNRALSMILVVCMVAALFAGCGGKQLEVPTTNPPATEAPADQGGEVVEPPVAELTFAQGTVLRMATGYNNAKT